MNRNRKIQAATTINPHPLWKKGIDLTGASIGLVVLTPLMIVIAVYIKLASRGPVLFRHKRYGCLGEPLCVLKFRTMHEHKSTNSHREHVMNLLQGGAEMRKLNTDSHLIPLGKWLRCTAVDELPQLFNVFKGEMSLVGPRPDVVPVEKYEDWQRRRFEVLPGLTGLWQVSGKNSTTFEEMNRLDVSYVEERSPWLDLRIVLLTLPAILALVIESVRSRNNSED